MCVWSCWKDPKSVDLHAMKTYCKLIHQEECLKYLDHSQPAMFRFLECWSKRMIERHNMKTQKSEHRVLLVQKSYHVAQCWQIRVISWSWQKSTRSTTLIRTLSSHHRRSDTETSTYLLPEQKGFQDKYCRQAIYWSDDWEVWSLFKERCYISKSCVKV